MDKKSLRIERGSMERKGETTRKPERAKEKKNRTGKIVRKMRRA